jgi:hypothetical protein
MNPKTKSKCRHCSQLFVPDHRNRCRQGHCSKPDCRRASKASSQRQWTSRPENKNYFSGADNCERVRQWRKEHPGYWRKKKSATEVALQDSCKFQKPVNESVALVIAPDALQDICFLQPALIVGLISTLVGSTLQEDIAGQAKNFLIRGQDILAFTSKYLPRGVKKHQTVYPSRSL